MAGTSTDGGRTWRTEKHGYGPCRLLSAYDAENAWVVTTDHFIATADGGATWAEVTLPEDIDVVHIFAINLRTPSDGYLLDTDGTLFVTQDGSKTWSSRSLGSLGRDVTIVNVAMPPLATLRFFDADRGLVIVNQDEGVLALRTTDGGQTWEKETVTTDVWGYVYLSHDGTFLTVTDIDGQITLFRYRGE
jgi:photosystem II stability/assembly factor-like uncharacterized protein